MKLDLNRQVPAGLPAGRELTWISVGLGASLLYSFRFLLTFFDSRSALYATVGKARVLIAGAVMPDFADVLGGSLLGFVLVALCMPALILYHYAYHYQGGRSIYLMRRLPNRWELHRRCFTVPLLAAAASLLLLFVFLLLYYGVYMAGTPDACLVPGQWRKLWEVLL